MVRTKQISKTIRKCTSSKQIKIKLKPTDASNIETEQQYEPDLPALQEIEMYQRSTELIIPKIQFQRLVKEVVNDIGTDIKFQVAALATLHEAAEAYIIGIFENTNLSATFAGRTTIMPKDIRLAMRISGKSIQCTKTE